MSIRKIRLASCSLMLLLMLLTMPVRAAEYNAFEFFELLAQSRFEELDRQLTAVQQGYEQGQYDDRLVAAAFYSFSNTDRELEERLSQWIQKRPESYAAYLARGVYYVHLGFLSRGGRFSSKTTDEQFDAMRNWFDKGSADLFKALELHPRLTVAYRHLMRISMTRSNPSETLAFFVRGRQVDPASYTVWNGYLFAMQPKWGGSIEDMKKAVQAMRPSVDKNPALQALAGYVPYAIGNSLVIYQEDHKQALAYYNQAVDMGEHHWFVLERGRTHYRLQQYEQALADFNRVLSLRPYHAEAFRWRGRVHQAMGQREAAMADYNTAVRLDKSDPDLRRDRGKLHRDLKQWEQALADFNETLILGSGTPQHWYWRGRVFLQLKQHEKAAADFRQATTLDPDTAAYWYYLAVALHSRRDCAIVPALKQYLALCEGKSCGSRRVDWSRNTLQGLEARRLCP